MMQVNPNLQFLRDGFDNPNRRIYKHQGGTRSGKTFSILQYLIELCYLYPNTGMIITVARKTLPALRATAYRDFMQLLESFGGYNEAYHNKTELTYSLNGNMWEFISLDQPQKIRGRKRTILFINEANECDLESWRQLTFRTTHKIILDFNPSDPEHWLYDLDSRPDCKTIITTYRDNPFLTPGQVREIELLKDVDPDYWAVFGNGEIGQGLRGRVFTHFKECDAMPGLYSKFYGLDFGYSNDPTALVEVEHHNNKEWVRERLYATNMTNQDIAAFCNENGIRGPIYADCAEPKSIEELGRLGLHVLKAPKPPGSVNAGIDKIKAMEVYFTSDSVNLRREHLYYQWALDAAGNPTNDPKDFKNHLMDAIRYANTHLIQSGPSWSAVF